MSARVKVSARRERAAIANALIGVIAGCGRRFFDHTPTAGYDGRPNGQVSAFVVDDHGRVWFVDGYTLARIYLPYRGQWRHFTEGGTLRALVEGLRAFVERGTLLPAGHFGPWHRAFCNGDLWGYGAAMEIVRAAAVGLGVVRSDAYGPADLPAEPTERAA